MKAWFVVEDAEGIWVVEATSEWCRYVGMPQISFVMAWQKAELWAGAGAIYTTLPEGIRRPSDTTLPRACYLLR